MKRFLVLIAVNMLPNGQTIQAREQSILDITLAPAFTAMALVKDQPDYYGSALLWDILRYKREDNAERLKFIFITNAHIIPGPYAINSFATTFDNFGGSIDGGSTEPVRLIAESVGYDLAAWTVDVAADRMDAAQVDRYQVLFKDVFPRLDLPVNSVRVSLVGNPSSRRIGNANTGWIYNAVWSKRLFSVISDPALLSPLDRVFSPPIDVEELTVTCPLVALQSCYRIPIPSSGYSGSAFLMGTDTAVKESKLHPIAGIVHGFEPLSDKTYVIPTKEIWKFYDKVKGLVLESSTPAQQLSKETVIDETESFLQLTMNAATIKIGGLVGKTITALQRSIPGGGLVSGGGGLVSGGGGLVSGGGGSLQLANGSKFTFVQRRLYDDQAGTYVNKQSIPDVVATDRPLLIKNDLATLQSDLLLEILEKTFLFRGVAQQMRYLPGVEMGGAQYLSFDHTPIANFAHFLKLHSDNPFLEPKVDLVSDPFPDKVDISKSDRPGILVSATTQKMIEIHALREKLKDFTAPRTNNSLAIDDETTAKLTAFAINEANLPSSLAPNVHLTTLKYARPDWLALFEGSMLRDNDTGKVTIRYVTPKYGTHEELVLPITPNRVLGNTFRYSGLCEYSATKDHINFSRLKAWVELIVEKSNELEDYEVKFVYAFMDVRGKLPEGALFELPILQVRGVYLPGGL